MLDTVIRAVMPSRKPKGEVEHTQPELLHPGCIALPGSVPSSYVTLAIRSLKECFLAASL